MGGVDLIQQSDQPPLLPASKRRWTGSLIKVL